MKLVGKIGESQTVLDESSLHGDLSYSYSKLYIYITIYRQVKNSIEARIRKYKDKQLCIQAQMGLRDSNRFE